MDAVDPHQSQPLDPTLPTPRKRPFGVLVVALIQLSAVAILLVSYLASWAMPWEGMVASYLDEHAWVRVLVVVFGSLVVIAAIGMWRFRRWGWALMVSLVGISLVLDLLNWWRNGGDDGLVQFGRMALDVVSAFYLNTQAVQDAFLSKPSPSAPAPVVGTQSAGRIDP